MTQASATAPAAANLAAQQVPWLWPYAALVGALGLAVWPAWTTVDRLIVGNDALLIHYPWFVLWRDALATGAFPFWNPYTFGGMPAFATLQAGYGYPLHWALTWMPPIMALNWTVGLHVLLAGVGAAWCAGRLGASKDGQFLSGIAYALGSAMTARMWAGHLSFLESNAWLPFATGLAIQIERRHTVTWLAIAVGLMVLGGQPELLIMSVWWLPLWAGLIALQHGPARVARALARTVIGIALGIGLAAFQLLPAISVLMFSNRQTGMPWAFLTGASLPPWHLLGLIAPLVFGDPQGTYWPSPSYEWHERLLYVGVVPLMAATAAPGRWRWICLGCAVLAAALAFGRYVPWYAWTQVLPGYQSFRIPSKHLVLAALALALGAGLGISRLHGRRVTFSALATTGLLILAGLTFALWFPAVAPLFGGSEALDSPGVRPSLQALAVSGLQAASVLLVLVAVLASFPPPWARRGMLLLAVVELVWVLQPFRIHPTDPQRIVDEAGPLRDFARAAVLGDDSAMFGNFGPVLRVVQPAGYVSLFSAEYMMLLTGAANSGVRIDVTETERPMLDLLGYGVIIDRRNQVVTVQDPTPPPVWVAHCSWPGTAQQVREPDFPRRACITRSTATVRDATAAPGAANIVSEGAGWLRVQADGPGWLVTIQPWYPGWSAWVDGVATTVEPVDGALVGLELPPGNHTIMLSYSPSGLVAGGVISIAVGLVLGVARWWDWRGRRLRRSTMDREGTPAL